MANNLTRRELIKSATMAAGIAAIGGEWTEGEATASRSPNERLNIAVIGCGGQGASDLGNVSRENIVALCDVDEARARDSFNKYPKGPKYADFRVMLEKPKEIEAVVVSCPGNTHPLARMMAIN